MTLNRRTFIRALIAVPLAPFIPIPKLAIDKLYGIDWGLNDATVGTWMGITRSTTPMFRSWIHKPTGKIDKELIALIRKMMDDASNHYQHQIDLATYAQPLTRIKK
jgi:hypothetical protein